MMRKRVHVIFDVLRLTFNAYPGTPPGMFGNNWWFSYESGLTYTEATARLVTGSGKPLTFAAPAPLGAASAGNPAAGRSGKPGSGFTSSSKSVCGGTPTRIASSV